MHKNSIGILFYCLIIILLIPDSTVGKPTDKFIIKVNSKPYRIVEPENRQAENIKTETAYSDLIIRNHEPEIVKGDSESTVETERQKGTRHVRSASEKKCKCEEKLETTTKSSSSTTTKKPTTPRTYRPPRVKSSLPIEDEAADWVEYGIKPKSKKSKKN